MTVPLRHGCQDATLRIARLSEHVPPHPGGKEIHVAELSRAQVLRGHDVSLWWRFGAPVPGVTSHKIDVPGPGDRRFGVVSAAAFAAAATRDVRRRSRPDVIHLHGDFPDAFFGGRCGADLRCPVVMTVHGGLNPLWRALSRVAFRRVDRFIAVGDSVAADLVRCGVASRRVTVLSSGVNRELLSPWIAARAPERGHVVSVGTLDPVKGVDTVIEAVRRLRLSHPDATLTVVGDGPARPALERAAADAPWATFVGRLDRAAVYATLARAAVFALGSRPLRRKAEGTPTALLEALALGVPVVATRSGGIAGTVNDGTTGVLVPPDDPEAMAAALRRVLDDELLREALATAGRAAVEARDWESVAERVDAVYGAALAEGPQ